MKKNYLLNVLILVLLIGTGTGKLLASEYYWVGNTGNWSDLTLWASSSGGAGSAYGVVPTSVDNVHFDANSFTSTGQTISIDPTQVSCLNMNWTGAANSPTLTFSSSGNILNISGSLTFVSAMSLTNCGPVNFIATTTGQTVTSAGQSFANNLTFDGAGGGWTLQDALTTTQNINFNTGTLNSNGQTVSGSQFISTTGNTRVLNMGSSVFNLSWISYPFWQVSGPGITINAGTSTVNATNTSPGWTPYFIGGGFTYYNLNFTGTNLGTGGGIIDDGGNTFNDVSFADNGAIYGSNIFHNVTFFNNGTIGGNESYNNLTFSPGFTYTLSSGETQTINGTFSATGNCSSGIAIQSSTTGAATISIASGTVTLDYVTLTYIAATGGATFIADDATDGGNNTGWTINVLPPQSLYWIGGTGNWSDGTHWSATSGGSPFNCSPGSGDDVFFDANSFTSAGQIVTLDASTANCNNMDWTGVTNVPTLAGSSSTLNIYGSLTLVTSGTGMNVTFSGPVNFNATTTGQTITSGGNSLNGTISFNGTGGWTLQDAFTTTQNINFNTGTLNSNGQTVSGSQFISTTGNTRVLNMGSSVFNLSWISYPFWNVTPTGMTVNGGTSTINATNTSPGWTPYFIGGGFTYYNLNFTGTNLGTGGGIIDDGGNTFNDVSFADNGAIYGSNIFHNVTFDNNGTIGGNESYNNLTFSPGFAYTLSSGETQTINGTFSATGSCTAGIAILSGSAAPTTISIASGTVTLDYVTLTYIAATGGATFIADDATDGGNNTGWTIHSNGAQNLYWVGNTGNWSDGSHWSATSGGSPLGCTPGSADNVFFDANSFTSAGQTVTLDASTANCNNMDWTGVTNVPTLAGSSSTLNIYGSLTLVTSGTGMNVTFSGPVNFNATTTGQTITSGGNSLNGSISFNGTGGWTLQDAFTTTQNINLNAGTLTSNNQTVSGSEFISTTSNTRVLNMGSSVFNLSWISYPFWNVTPTGMTVNGGTSTINATNNQIGWTPYFVGGGFTYYNLNFTGTNLGSGGGIIEDGGNTFNDVLFADNGAINGGNTFHNVTFDNNGTITANETYNNLTFSPAYTYILTSSTTQTVNGQLSISGTGGFPVRIEASTSGSPATISMPGVDTVCADYIRISDNTATGGAVFIAGTNSQDLGGNTGWNFASPSTAPGTLNSSSNPICSGGSGTTLTQSGGSLGVLAYWQWYSDAGYTTKVGGQLSSSNASLVVTPIATTTYYLRAEWPSCISPLPGPGTGVTVTVNTSVTPVVSIGITTGTNPTCSAVPVTFTATPTNGGSTPTYNFEVNSGSVQNSTSATYTTSSLNNGDQVTCIMTSDAACASPTSIGGNTINMIVNACGTNTWLGYTTAWATGSNWSVGVPTQTTDGLIPSAPVGGFFPTVSSAALVRNIEVDDNATITLNNTLNVYGTWTGGRSSSSSILGSSALILSGSALQTLSGLTQFQILELNNSSGAQMQTGSIFDIFTALVLENGQFDANTFNGTLILRSVSTASTAYIDDFFNGSSSGTYLGNLTAQRFFGAATAFNDFKQHMLGSPVSGINLSDLGSNSGSSAYYIAATGGIHNCNELVASPITPYGNVFSYDETHANLCTMDGWKVGAASTAVLAGTGYSVILGSGSGTFSLTGPPNLNASYSVATTNSDYANTTSDQGRSYSSGINLVSNPYPATLDVSSLNTANSTNFSSQTVYVWNVANGSYDMNPATIAPFQAFKVIQSASGPRSYTIPGSSRTTTAGTFQRTANPIELNMTVTNNGTGLTDNTIVGFNPNSTAQFDAVYDVIKLPGALSRHTMYTLNSNYWLAVNVLKSINETSTVAVGFEPGVSGTYTANFSGLNSFDPTSYIRLEDQQTGTMFNVRNGDYTFTSDASDNFNRFILHFTPPASINTTDATCSEQGMINIIQPGSAIWNYTLADNNNVILSSGTLNVNSPVSASIPAGVYTLTLKDSNGYTVVKTVEVNGVQPVLASFTTSANSVNVNQNVNLSSTTANAVLNSWNFGDGTTDNGATVSHAYANEGVYNVTLNSTSASGCNSSASNTITVTRSVTAVTDLNDISNILIWSNENMVTVDFTQLRDVQANIEIYNILGQKLSEDKYVTSTVYHKEIPNIEEGYIVVSVKNNDAIITKKLFINNVK